MSIAETRNRWDQGVEKAVGLHLPSTVQVQREWIERWTVALTNIGSGVVIKVNAAGPWREQIAISWLQEPGGLDIQILVRDLVRAWTVGVRGERPGSYTILPKLGFTELRFMAMESDGSVVTGVIEIIPHTWSQSLSA